MSGRFALLSLVLLAGLLRFSGLSWGLRHVPHWDERVFVDNVWEMHARGDFDHRYYEYPGLFPLILYPAVGAVYREGLPTREAFLAARGVVALLGVLNVGLVYVLGVRLHGRSLGLAAALLLAVSPVDINTSHAVRPDVALQTAVLLAMLAYSRLGAAVRGDLGAGLATGAAVAVKFTGAFLVPSYLAARWLAPGPRLSRVALAGLLGALVLVGATPYALINRAAFFEGLGVQFGAHYSSGGFAPEFQNHIAYYLGKIVFMLGPLGASLAGIGLLSSRRRWRRWLPLLLHILTTLVVMATAEVRFYRHLVPIAGLLCLFAALPLADLGSKRPRLALVAALLAAAWPLGSSLREVTAMAGPSTADRALDWIEEHAVPGALILNGFRGLQQLGIDHSRYDVMSPSSSPERNRRLAREADIVIAVPPTALHVAGWTPTFLVEPESEFSGPAIGLLQVLPSERFLYSALPFDARQLTSSENPEALAGLVDGRPMTRWNTTRPQRAGDWIEVRFPGPTAVARIEMVMGPWPERFARSLEIESQADGEGWRTRDFLEGRPDPNELLRSGRPVSQVLLIDSEPVTAIRVVSALDARRKWGMAELRFFVPRGDP